MVCKKSLYCWKNGPCASDQARKKIWEDNIRFRESLRDINQSDHYWSFQISKNICLCLEEELCQSKSLTKRCTGSLQKLNEIDCTSITHECNGLKIRNCYIHCPSLDFPQKNNELKQADTPIPKTLCAKENKATCTELPPKQPRALHKTNENKPQFCHKYINTLPNSNLKPSSKIKFPSQSNLSNISKSSGSLKKKNSHGSCQDISSMIKGNHCVSPNTKLENGSGLKVQQKGVNTAESELKREIKFKKPKKELKPLLLSQSRQSLHDYAPVSRTTRKMYDGNKIVPFVTFGCNNNNIDIGTKRTHNVLASKVEVYPNALTAKQQKKDLILKYLQSEKEFQKKCFPENLKKGLINHSSLWSTEIDGKENKLSQRKNSKQVLPRMTKPLKRQSSGGINLESFPYKTYRKPQFYFY